MVRRPPISRTRGDCRQRNATDTRHVLLGQTPWPSTLRYARRWPMPSTHGPFHFRPNSGRVSRSSSGQSPASSVSGIRSPQARTLSRSSSGLHIVLVVLNPAMIANRHGFQTALHYFPRAARFAHKHQGSLGKLAPRLLRMVTRSRTFT